MFTFWVSPKVYIELISYDGFLKLKCLNKQYEYISWTQVISLLPGEGTNSHSHCQGLTIRSELEWDLYIVMAAGLFEAR